MRRRLLVLLGLVPFLAGALVLSWHGDAATASNRPPALASFICSTGCRGMPACADANVTFRLVTNSLVYLPGQPVRVSLEVRNTGAGWCRVTGQCNEVATLAIFDSRRMLWSDRPCYNADWDAVAIALAPGRLVTSRGAWTTTDIHSGWYEARAAFLKVPFLVL